MWQENDITYSEARTEKKIQLDTGKSQGCLLTQKGVLKNEHPTLEKQ